MEFADDVFTRSQVEFVKTDLETRWYFPLLNPFILRLNGQLGIVSNIDPRKPVPLQERYLIGGPQTIRGFQRFSLGPTRDTPRASEDYGSPLTPFRLGGTKQLLLTAEIEFPIFTAINLRGVVFADAGNAFDTNQPFTLVPDLFQNDANDFDDALRTAVGFGFRWFSPIGLLRFEWGIPLRRLSTEDPLVFDFSIGNAF
ncbi:MAG: BamA/TamA family outer membrane protein [Myxococcota bacterium]